MKNTTTNNIQKVKDDLIAELDKRIADKIIEKTNADLLNKLKEQANTINEAIMIAELGTTYKRTGFHFDKRLEKMTDTIKYFKKNEKLSFVQDKNALTHKLIIGDNYDALLNLLIEYRGKIDVIYIDPPYGKDSMGEFAQTNYENAITRDNLLSMLYPRLVLARQLLSDTGVIFCSIDDKNQAYVKGLFDEVFEEGNFVANVPRTTSFQRSGQEKYMNISHDYILIFKNKNDREDFANITERDIVKEIKEDKNGKYIEGDTKAILAAVSQGYSKGGDYDFEYNGKTYSPIDSKGNRNRWLWSKERMQAAANLGILVETKNSLRMQLYLDKKFEEKTNKLVEKVDELRFHTADFMYEKFDNPRGTTELEDILMKKNLFANPKPVELIKHLIKFSPNQEAIILDFFAGSGTTGQAVLELNKQDSGNRQFILATANEITNTTPNGIVNDVTSKRLKRVMTGECYDGTKDFKWNDKNKPLGDNLDVYDIATVAPYSDEPFEKIDETLYGKEKLEVKEKIKWVCENFEGTQKTLEDK